MKQLITTILFIFSYHILSGQDEKVKKEIEQLSWDWMNAWKAKDMILLEKILAPEYRLLAVINGELATMDRKKWLETVPVYIPKNFRYYNFDIRTYGNTAVVQSMFDQEATLNGQDRSGTFQITDIWIKNKYGWQVVHRHTNLKPSIAQVSQELKRELIQREQALNSGVVAKDTAALKQILTDEFHVTRPQAQGRWVARPRWLANLLQMSLDSASISDVSVSQWGDIAVFRAHHHIYNWVVGGTVRPPDALVTDLWVKRDGRWQLVTRLSEPMPK